MQILLTLSRQLLCAGNQKHPPRQDLAAPHPAHSPDLVCCLSPPQQRPIGAMAAQMMRQHAASGLGGSAARQAQPGGSNRLLAVTRVGGSAPQLLGAYGLGTGRSRGRVTGRPGVVALPAWQQRQAARCRTRPEPRLQTTHPLSRRGVTSAQQPPLSPQSQAHPSPTSSTQPPAAVHSHACAAAPTPTHSLTRSNPHSPIDTALHFTHAGRRQQRALLPAIVAAAPQTDAKQSATDGSAAARQMLGMKVRGERLRRAAAVASHLCCTAPFGLLRAETASRDSCCCGFTPLLHSSTAQLRCAWGFRLQRQLLWLLTHCGWWPTLGCTA
jgi:hypothetical protein